MQCKQFKTITKKTVYPCIENEESCSNNGQLLYGLYLKSYKNLWWTEIIFPEHNWSEKMSLFLPNNTNVSRWDKN